MQFAFNYRASDSPFVHLVWRTHSMGEGSFISPASSHLELVITRQAHITHVTVRGPETKASPAPIPEDAEFMGITFRLGTFMPGVPAPAVLNKGLHLPLAAGQSFWLQGAAWPFPTFENVDTFVDRLVHHGALASDPVVAAVLDGQLTPLSARSVQRRFLRATGLTRTTIVQIERARRAAALLQQGVSILDTIEQAGYYDQPHLTRALRRYIGQTPAQLTNLRKDE